jgi:transposase-like protein
METTNIYIRGVIMKCKDCGDKHIVKYGWIAVIGRVERVQRYKCQKCNYIWVDLKSNEDKDRKRLIMPCEKCNSYDVEKFGLMYRAGYVKKLQRYHCNECDNLWVDLSSSKKIKNSKKDEVVIENDI